MMKNRYKKTSGIVVSYWFCFIFYIASTPDGRFSLLRSCDHSVVGPLSAGRAYCFARPFHGGSSSRRRGVFVVPSAVYISLKRRLACSSSLRSCGFFSPFGRDSSQDAGQASCFARPLRGGSSISRTG